MVRNRSVNKAARCSLAGGILGILSLILFDAPFVTQLVEVGLAFETVTSSYSFSGLSLLTPGPIGPLALLWPLLWLMVAGGIGAAVTGFILTGQLMHGRVFSSTFDSRNAAKLIMVSGMLMIAGTIAGLVQILVVVNLVYGGVFGSGSVLWGVGWGLFAELVIGPAISVLASVTLRRIP
jgi:hypothetical protein